MYSYLADSVFYLAEVPEVHYEVLIILALHSANVNKVLSLQIICNKYILNLWFVVFFVSGLHNCISSLKATFAFGSA